MKRRAAVALAGVAVVAGALILVAQPAQYHVYLPITPAGEARKAGVAMAWSHPTDCYGAVYLGTWSYNWGLTTDCRTTEFIPMVWGRITDIPVLADNGKWLMGMNECNYIGQCDLSPTEAAAQWHLLEETGRKLISPAVSACENPQNPACLNNHWLEQFMAACVGCRIDALALHYYTCSVDDLWGYLDRRHQQYPRLPIWLTEFCCPTYAGDPVRFMREAVPILEGLHYVARYAAFATHTDGFPECAPLIDDHSNLTALGQAYQGD